jgi:hypothetical protein
MAALAPKEGLYQEEKITARISGRKRRKRQKTIIPYVGGEAARWLPKPCTPPPSWRNYPQNRWICRLSPRGWAAGDAKGPRMARKWPEKCPRVVRQGVTWPVWWGVRKRDFFIYSSINGYFKKPILQGRGAKTFFYLTSMSKSAYFFSTSCEKRISCLYSVCACI